MASIYPGTVWYSRSGRRTYGMSAPSRRGGRTRVEQGRRRQAPPAGAARHRPASPGLGGRLRAFQRDLRERLAARDALLDLVHAVNATLVPSVIADLVVARAASWVPADCWALEVADTSGTLTVLGQQGLDSHTGPRVAALARHVMRTGEAVFSADASRLSLAVGRARGAVVALPLNARGRRVGVLVGLDREPSATPVRLARAAHRAVEALVEPVVTALDTALLLKRAEALSVTDDLTGLYNSRYMNQVLRRETKRASRSGRPLSLLFIDLDGFKQVNDTHGHLCGSRALVEAAGLIRACARETDVVARFGGDEFAVILPDTGGEGASAVGGRIRRRLADHCFLAADGLSVGLTASVGVATFPEAAGSAQELVGAADRAMYQVKASGKNGLQAAAVSTDN